MLKNGTKVIELRLFDEKRQTIKIGDIIKFHNSSDENDNFEAIVIKLHRAENFENLCGIISPLQAGFENKETLITVLKEFYPLAKQNINGVLGIEIATRQTSSQN